MDPHVVRNWQFDILTQAYAERDTMLYALGLGIGHDPIDAHQLQFVTEPHLAVVPTMAAVLGSPGLWIADRRTGIDWVRAVHGEQDLRLMGSLPTSGEVSAVNHVVAIADKGEGRGALVRVRRILTAGGSTRPVAEIHSTLFLRADGGFSASDPSLNEAIAALPGIGDRGAPDLEVMLPTIPQAALIYRLSGDLTPLHSDPAVAAAAGFPRPILHGLCPFGMAAYAALRAFDHAHPARLRRIAARFSAPSYPGETMRFAFYRETGTSFRMRATVVERDVVILDNGIVEFSEQGQ